MTSLSPGAHPSGNPTDLGLVGTSWVNGEEGALRRSGAASKGASGEASESGAGGNDGLFAMGGCATLRAMGVAPACGPALDVHPTPIRHTHTQIQPTFCHPLSAPMSTEPPQDLSPALSPDTQADAPAADDTVKTAGRGFLVITAAKLYFMVTGAAIQIGLPSLFGTPEEYGVFKIITELVSLINMVVITGTMQAVAKLVSEEPQKARRLVNQALKLQCMLGVPLALGYAATSGVIAEHFLNDASLANLMRLSSLIILFYAFYAIFVGYLNGVKSFVRQAVLDISFQTLKCAGILGLVILGMGVAGAISGFVAAAGVVCVVSGLWVWRVMQSSPAPAQTIDAGEERARIKRLAGFLFLVMIYTFALNGLMRADLFVLKSVTATLPTDVAALAQIAKTTSDKFAGIYGGALNLARLPFQGVIAVTFVIFPLISEATFQEDKQKTQAYIRSTFRYCLLLIGAVALPLIFNSDAVLAVVYPAEYMMASGALAILSVGIIFFSLLFVAMTIFIGAGKPGVAGVIMFISLGISAALNYVALTSTHPDAAALKARAGELSEAALATSYFQDGATYMNTAATSTTIAMVIGFLLAMGWLYKTYRAAPPLLTIGRLVLCAAALWGVDLLWSVPVELVVQKGKVYMLGMVMAKMITMGLTMIVVLAATLEFNKDDVARFRAVLGR